MSVIEEKMERFEQKLINIEDQIAARAKACDDSYLKTCEQLSQLTLAQQTNTLAIADLVKETAGMVQLHKDLKGVTRLGSSVQSFGLWLLKWPLIGAGAYAAFNWVVAHLPTN